MEFEGSFWTSGKDKLYSPLLCALLRQMLYRCSALCHAGDTAAVTNTIFLCFGNVFKDWDEAESRRDRAMQ